MKIEARNIRKVFESDGNDVVAIDNINLGINENEFTVIVGPSGCGKTTFLYMLAGFEQQTSGQIFLDGKAITKPAPDRGFVFQEYTLFPWRTVKRNIAFGLEMQEKDTQEINEIVDKYIKLVGLEGFENVYPHTLSGGMKQRVAIARALAYEPDVLLMDEPFGALDAQTRKLMQEELVRIWEHKKKTVVFITHSVIEAIYLADTIYVMTARPGRVKKKIENDLERPRDYKGAAFLKKREEVLELLEEEVKK